MSVTVLQLIVRGVLPLPVKDRPEPHRMGAWVEVNEASFLRVLEFRNTPDQKTKPAL